jgi:hypothetical protein
MGLRFMVMGRHMKMCIRTTMIMMSYLKKDQTNNIDQKLVGTKIINTFYAQISKGSKVLSNTSSMINEAISCVCPIHAW